MMCFLYIWVHTLFLHGWLSQLEVMEVQFALV
jgi:hypothetical protein